MGINPYQPEHVPLALFFSFHFGKKKKKEANTVAHEAQHRDVNMFKAEN